MVNTTATSLARCTHPDGHACGDDTPDGGPRWCCDELVLCGSADLPASLADLRAWSLPGRELARFFQAAILVELEVEELGLACGVDVLRRHRGELGEEAAAEIVGNILGFALVERPGEEETV